MKKSFISLLIFLWILLSQTATYANLIAYWQFEGDGTDATGNGHTGSTQGNIFYQEDNSAGGLERLGTSIYFDGNSSNEFIVGYQPDLNFTTSYTFSMWIKPVLPAASYGSLLGRYYTAIGDSYGLYITSSQTIGPIMYKSNSSKIFYQYHDADFVTDEWQHLVVTYDNQYVKIYRNGVLKASPVASGIINSTVAPLYIGSLTGDGDSAYQYRGWMDEVMLYDTALDDTEVLMLYNNTLNTATAIPEPATIIIFMTALLTFFARKKSC